VTTATATTAENPTSTIAEDLIRNITLTRTAT